MTPASHLTADGAARAHGAQAGAGAPPSPPGGGGRGHIVMSPAMCGLGSGSAQATLTSGGAGPLCPGYWRPRRPPAG